MAHKGLICFGCHNWRNNFKARVRNRLNERELEIEDLKAQTRPGYVKQTHKVVGFLCEKCSIKTLDAVRNRPFGQSWREAFRIFKFGKRPEPENTIKIPSLVEAI